MPQPLPDILKGIFEIQFAGVLRVPFPDFHTAISIFKIQFAVVTTTSTYPKGIFPTSLDASSGSGLTQRSPTL